MYQLTEEHELLRQTVRDLAQDVIAPRAAEIDAQAEYPWDVHEALKAADLLAIHVPEEYGGAGADKIAHCLVVEEIARVCASSSLIPMGNKLGTTGPDPRRLARAEAALPAGGREGRGLLLVRALRA